MTTTNTATTQAETNYISDLVSGQQEFVRQYRMETSHCSRRYWRYMVSASTLRDRQYHSRALQFFVRELMSEGRDPRPILRALVTARR